MLGGVASQGAYEMALFSDSRFTGMVTRGYGPYQFLNTIAPHDETMRLALVLRVEQFLIFELNEELKTREDHYHGGGLGDEVAALASLCLGVRLKAGSVIREFGASNDPRGWPVAYEDRTPLLNLSGRSGRVVPLAQDAQRSLDGLAPMQALPRLSPQAAGALVQSARLYQEALWVCESEPALAWLLFVSAVETAANFWRAAMETPVERLKASRPELETLLLEEGGTELLEKVANQIAQYMGATKKFIDFVWEFLPPAPKARPWDWAQHSWNKKSMCATLSKIYSYRSRALHGGIPFPAPMCFSPLKLDDVYAEKPSGMASGTGQHQWMAEDTPIHLHLFAYIVRGSLLKWWNTLSPQPETQTPPEPGQPGDVADAGAPGINAQL